MKLLEIIPYMDYVLIEGQRVSRPDHISRKRWLDYWESLR